MAETASGFASVKMDIKFSKEKEDTRNLANKEVKSDLIKISMKLYDGHNDNIS